MPTIRPLAPITLLLATLVIGGCVTPSATPSVPERDADLVVDYTVRPGDRLGDIALKLTGELDTWREIAAFNDIDDPRRLHAGTVLRVPVSLLSEPVGTDVGGGADAVAEGSGAPGGATSSPAFALRRTTPPIRPATGGGRDAKGVALARIDVNRSFELVPQDVTRAGRGIAAPSRQIKVIGSYFPKGVYAEPALSSRVITRVTPGALFELERNLGDWYGITTEAGPGYLRAADARIVDAAPAAPVVRRTASNDDAGR